MLATRSTTAAFRVLVVATAVSLLTIAVATRTPHAEKQYSQLEQRLQEYIDCGYLKGIPFSGSPEIVTVTDKVKVSPVLDDVYTRYLVNCLSALNRRTGDKFRAIQINKTLAFDAVNVYVIEDDPDQLFGAQRPWGPIHDNMAYIGWKNIILCDARLFDRLSDTSIVPLDFDDAPEWVTDVLKNQLRAQVRNEARLLWIWILGHEIGHIACGHGSDCLFHSNLDKMRFDQQRAPSAVAEQEADDFAIECISGSLTQVDALMMQRALSGFVNRECLRRFDGQSLSDVMWSEEPICIQTQQEAIHLPLVVRALSLCAELTERYDLETPNKFADMKKRIRLRYAVVD